MQNEYMLSFATLMFTGHLGTLELAGASIDSVGIQGLAYGIMLVVTNTQSVPGKLTIETGVGCTETLSDSHL